MSRNEIRIDGSEIGDSQIRQHFYHRSFAQNAHFHGILRCKCTQSEGRQLACNKSTETLIQSVSMFPLISSDFSDEVL
jgi:hypothetical protein